MRTFNTMVVGAAVAAAALTAGAPAQASVQTSAQTSLTTVTTVTTAAAAAGSTAMSCREVRVYRPEMRKGHVAATGWAIGCSSNQRVKIMLQRKRAWGWQNISSASWYGAGKKTLYKGCKRGTIFTYRLQGQVSYYAGRKYVVHNGWSPKMRAKCP
ncbi:hypothetical protein SAMN05216275_11887 [Streptosporangium canum]|uniref:Secreted protein n=1 Tax=Streptosporangium canum TaxID=324952 RepID=A0A1I3X7P1_9ACTN|nr:hypothetical protein [Streptosporangium canum]SFK14891.1 hypothetical protein SAMN05216275_11887 [Streptosporangium canum]